MLPSNEMVGHGTSETLGATAATEQAGKAITPGPLLSRQNAAILQGAGRRVNVRRRARAGRVGMRVRGKGERLSLHREKIGSLVIEIQRLTD